MLLCSRATAFFVPLVARPKKNDFVDEPSIGSFAVFSRGRRLKPTLLRGAGPWPVFDICDKAGFDGIVFDVIFYSPKLTFVTNPVIKTFCLPELTRAVQDRIQCSSARALQFARHESHLHKRRKQHVDVICHHRVGMQIELTELECTIQQHFDHRVGDGRILELQRALCGPVQQFFGEAEFLCRFELRS